MLILRKSESGLKAQIGDRFYTISPTADGMVMLLNLLNWHHDPRGQLASLETEETNQYKNFLAEANACRNAFAARELALNWSPIISTWENRTLAATAEKELALVESRFRPATPSKYSSFLEDL